MLPKKSKNCLQPIFSQFQAILNNFDFFILFQEPYFFLGVGAKKTRFRPIFSQFQAILHNLTILTTDFCTPPITPKFILTIFLLVRPFWKCKLNFRPLQPFLLGNFCGIASNPSLDSTNERTTERTNERTNERKKSSIEVAVPT